MAADIEQFYAWRPTTASGDKIGVTRHYDPLLAELVLGEQVALFGNSVKWIKILDAGNTVDTLHPAKGAVAITTSLVGNIAFGADFGFSTGLSDVESPTGLLAWIVNDSSAGGLTNQVRKLVSASGNTHAVNRDWHGTEVPAAADTYELLIPTLRYNYILLRAEYSASSTLATIVPIFYSVNHDLVQATPGVFKPIPYVDRAVEIANSGIGHAVLACEKGSGFFHGEILAIPTHGSLGAKILLKAISGGTVTLWASPV